MDLSLEKPKLRGVSHEVSFYVALVALVGLALAASGAAARTAAIVYGVSLAMMFGASAAYHRPTWKPRARAWMRRLDHAAIYVLIAGTYTPFALVLRTDDAHRMLAVAWVGATLGILKSLLWVDAPKPLSAALYMMLGWAVVPFWSEVLASIGWTGFGLMAAGGAAYTVGAFVYALRKPNPFPGWFGYHEVFHALVIVAAILHFAAVARLLGQITGA